MKNKEKLLESAIALRDALDDFIGKLQVGENAAEENGEPKNRLVISAGARYYEDAEVNDEEDDDDDPRMPLVVDHDGEKRWDIIINVDTGKIVGWPQGTTARIHYKVCDDFECNYYKDGKYVCNNDGHYYVPDFMCPDDDGYGDYIICRVDEDGAIKDFDKSKVEKWAKNQLKWLKRRP